MRELEAVAVVDRAERKRFEAVADTLLAVGSRGETVAEVAHDARNMLTALGLYCDLLEEPGVLANPYMHYGSELRMVAAASRKLVDKLATMDSGSRVLYDSRQGRKGGSKAAPTHSAPEACEWVTAWDPKPSLPVGSMAVELLANHNLLAALAGSSVTLTIDVDGGARPIWMTGEDLTRVLVNLVKNAAEAMPDGGRVQIELSELPASAGAVDALLLTVEDNGPGIPVQSSDAIFEAGHTTRGTGAMSAGGRAATHRGLGLAIVRSIVEGAGGRVCARNHIRGGARFEIELPVRTLSR
jgi:Signal transduction histidine kinase